MRHPVTTELLAAITAWKAAQSEATRAIQARVCAHEREDEARLKLSGCANKLCALLGIKNMGDCASVIIGDSIYHVCSGVVEQRDYFSNNYAG